MKGYNDGSCTIALCITRNGMVSTCGYERDVIPEQDSDDEYRARQQYDTCDDVSMQTYCVTFTTRTNALDRD